MNFLSHYYVFFPSEDPAFVTGLVLPDLTRKAHKRFRLKAAYEELPDEFQMLQKGVRGHFETDEIFHAAPFFKKHTAGIKSIAREMNVFSESKYLYFLAHITFEMVLDKILLQRHSEIGIDFYDLLQSVDANLLNSYFEATGNTTYIDAFQNYFQRFNESRFLIRYAEPGGLAYALQRVFSRATLTSSSIDDSLLDRFVEKCEDYLEPFFDDVFQSVETSLAAQ